MLNSLAETEINILQQHVDALFSRNKPVIFRCYQLNDKANQSLDILIRQLTSNLSQESYRPVVYAICKEFMVNGLKANVKRILFDSKRINIFDPEEYEQGMLTFKKEISPENIAGYLHLLKSNNLYVQSYLSYSSDYLIADISNNVLMTDFEAKKIIEKFNKMNSYDSVGAFFEDNIEEEEGAGLGFLLVMQMLKNLDIPGSINVYKNELFTLIRIIFPFTQEQFTMPEFPVEGNFQTLI